LAISLIAKGQQLKAF